MVQRNSAQYQIPEAVACIRKMCTIEAQKLANLLAMLAKVPEADGTSLLDHTLPHNNLYVSLANAMGIDIDTFGNPAVCTGPLAGLTG